MNRPNPADPAPTALPTTLRWAVRLLVAEGLAVAVAAGVLGYVGLTGDSESLTATLAVPGYVLVMGAALGAVAAALARRKPRARAPAIVLQLLGVVVAYFLTSAGMAWWSILVAAVALTVIALLVAPGTNQALAR